MACRLGIGWGHKTHLHKNTMTVKAIISFSRTTLSSVELYRKLKILLKHSVDRGRSWNFAEKGIYKETLGFPTETLPLYPLVIAPLLYFHSLPLSLNLIAMYNRVTSRPGRGRLSIWQGPATIRPLPPATDLQFAPSLSLSAVPTQRYVQCVSK